MRTGPGAGGSSTSDLEKVSKSRIDSPQRLISRERCNHGPELGPAVLPGQRASDRAQMTADGLQLTDDLLRRIFVELTTPLSQLPETLERLTLIGQRDRGRLE